MAKDSSLKVFVVGEVLRASHLNQMTENVGAVGYLAPWNSQLSKDSAGVVFLGTTAYPVAGVVLQPAYKLLTSDGSNTTEISIGGDNSGHLGIIETRSELEKQSINYAISERFSSHESFSGKDVPFNVVLGKNYGTGDLTLINLHNNYQSISKCNAVGDGTGTWTSLGAQASSATVGGTNSIEGGASIHVSVSATTGENGLRFKLGTNSFNIVDGKVRYALYLSTLSNISSVKTLLADVTGTANSSYWNLTTQASGSSLVAGAWNFMEANIQGTASGSTGSITLGALREVHILITPTSSQAFNMDIDDLCAVSKYEIDTPTVYQIADSSNTQLVYVASGANGTYQLGTSVVNNYSIGSVLKKRYGAVENNQFTFPTGTNTLSGNSAKQVWDIKTEYFDNSITNKNLSISQRFDTPTYQIIDVPSTNSIKIKTITGTGDVLSFVKNDEIIVFHRKWDGCKFVSKNNTSFGNNFKLLTVTGSSTVSGSEITINTSESTTGIDANGEYFLVNNVVQTYYAVSPNITNAGLTKVNPSAFTKMSSINSIKGLTAYWKMDETSGNALDASGNNRLLEQVGTIASKSGKFKGSRGVYSNSNYFVFLTGSATSVFDKLLFAVGGWFKASNTGAIQTIFSKQPGANGWGCRLDASGVFRFTVYPTSCLTTSVYTDNQWHHFIGINRQTSGTNELRLYIDGKIPDSGCLQTGVSQTLNTSDMIIGTDTANPLSGGYLDDLFYLDLTGVPYSWIELETFIQSIYNNGIGRHPENDLGYLATSQITNVTGSKLVTASKVVRSNTVGHVPILHERNAIIT